MESVIDEIYEEVFKNIDKYAESNCISYDNETAKLLKEFKECMPLAQMDLFERLWRSVLNGNYSYGLTQFKGGFKMGFKLACECLKG